MIDFEKLAGLVPAVMQDEETREVLMVGFMNEEALALTRRTGYATFFSRSRNALWTKGETSGNRLAVRQVLTDCDEDTILVKVKRLGDGNVCHTGERSCFFRELPVESRPAPTGAAPAGTGATTAETGVAPTGNGAAPTFRLAAEERR